VARTARAEETRGCVVGAFENEFVNHLDESGMHAGSCGANHSNPEFVREVLRFEVEVLDHFHVVRDKTDRRDNDLQDSLASNLP